MRFLNRHDQKNVKTRSFDQECSLFDQRDMIMARLQLDDQRFRLDLNTNMIYFRSAHVNQAEIEMKEDVNSL